jgi:excisionase family DNA binding protein
MARPTPTPPLTAGVEHTNTNGTGRLLTAEDLAARWQVKTSHVYRLTREGVLPAVRLGRYYRYRLEAVDKFERDGGVTDG